MSDVPILSDDDAVSLPSEVTVKGRTAPRGARLTPGDVLLGRYTVLSELGEGGMGVVYKCLDSVGGIEVALKCLPPELSRNEAEMEGIRENYALVARLHHSAISGLRNLEKDPDFGEYYLVMDLAEGEDLSVLLRRRHGAPMPLPEALAILRPLAAALDYAHGEKVLHRDVKPANVKVAYPASGGAPRVQLLDFGLAAEVRSSLSRVSRKGHLGSSGTPSYMAPEQWEARRQTPATDQYALAVVAYQMLSGAPPFEADDPDLLRRAVLSREPDPVPGLSRRANAALLRALAKDPAARFPSCTAFVNEAGRAVPASRGGSAGTPRPTRRRLALAAAAVLAVGALGALLLSPTRGGGELSPHAESAKLESHAESAESAEQGGEAGPLAEGAAERSEAGGVSRAEPGWASSPSEPPEGAPLEELQAARGRLADALDARRADGWPDDSEKSASLLASISSLDGRVEAALAAQERAQRADEAAARSRRTAEARAEADISRLKAAAARDARDVQKYRKWNDGEFRTQFEALDGRRKALDACSKAADLDRAKAAAADVRAAAVWIADNAAAREEIDGLEKAAAEAARACAEAEAGRYAKAALYRADTARNDAVRRRDRSDWAGAKEKFEQAGTLYGETLTAAKAARAAARAADALADAEAAKAREDWSAVLAAAEKALEWDAGNEAAKALKTEAEKSLRPKWLVSATLPGGAAATGAKLALGGKTHTLPARLGLEDGKSYGPGEVTLEKDGKTYVGTLERTTVDWKGERKAVVALVERTEPNLGERRIVSVDGVELALRWCPSGSFLMGSPTSEDGRSSDETQHRVMLTAGFWMGETEVTQGLWKKVMGGNDPSYFISGDEYPVESVAWNDCQDFLKKLNSKAPVAGFEWRLPTEAQWEYACRAGSSGAFAGTGRLDNMGWYDGNSGGRTHPVAQKTANAWGLYDMHGNVWEWCADWYGSYPSGTVTDPAGPSSGSDRVCRGGSWGSNARDCRSASRSNYDPGFRYFNLGFRVALVPVQGTASPFLSARQDRQAGTGGEPEASGRTSEGERAARSAAASRSEKGFNGILDLGSGVSLEMVHCPGVAPDFWMGKYEVTQEQWQHVMGTTPSYFKNKPKNPVENVSWDDCQEFIRKLNALPAVKESGLTFRLPTEEEWETACRAGAPKSEVYCKLADGTQITMANLSRVAWFGKGWDVGPTEVGKNREPNAWGLYDMHGNVWEWTQTAVGVIRVNRGGSFNGSAGNCAAGNRDGLTPVLRGRFLGFRLAASGRTAAK